MQEKLNKNLSIVYSTAAMLMITLCVVGVLYAINLFREGRLIGSSASNTISVSGTGKVTAKPDISNITFTVREQAKDNKEGQDKIAKKISVALADLKKVIDEKDIKTNTYNSYPRYSYPLNAAAKLDGYDVTQNVTVKVRNVDDVAKVLDIISKAGINEVSGPEYSVDNDNKYKDEAREMAIKDAKSKAEKLASQLGVNLVRIVSFSENAGGYVQPMYMMKAEGKVMSDSAVAPQLPVGENEISSNINIIFEIK